MASNPEEKSSIFDKPLPLILEEIEAAAAESRRAADEAKAAGEKAAEDVMKRLGKLFLKMSEDITDELGESK